MIQININHICITHVLIAYISPDLLRMWGNHPLLWKHLDLGFLLLTDPNGPSRCRQCCPALPLAFFYFLFLSAAMFGVLLPILGFMYWLWYTVGLSCGFSTSLDFPSCLPAFCCPCWPLALCDSLTWWPLRLGPKGSPCRRAMWHIRFVPGCLHQGRGRDWSYPFSTLD